MADSGNQRLEEVQAELRRLNEGDRDVYMLTAARGLLEVVEGFVDRVCTGVEVNGPADFSTSLILRCIAKKTQESLSTIVGLAEREQGYYAMALLRPMCEELIFARFLKTLPREDASKYIGYRIMLDLYEGLLAQKNFFDQAQEEWSIEESWRGEPHSGEIQDLPTKVVEQKDELRKFGSRHSWGSRPSPSVKQMAERTDSLAEYEFFYHAASNAVHANLHHLGRMVWKNFDKGVVSITNKNFDAYYRAFVLTYGVWLTHEVMNEVMEEFPDQWREEDRDIYATWLGALIVPAISLRRPPIVTTEELWWPREQTSSTGGG
jgi:hypothetical protein